MPPGCGARGTAAAPLAAAGCEGVCVEGWVVGTHGWGSYSCREHSGAGLAAHMQGLGRTRRAAPRHKRFNVPLSRDMQPSYTARNSRIKKLRLFQTPDQTPTKQLQTIPLGLTLPPPPPPPKRQRAGAPAASSTSTASSPCMEPERAPVCGFRVGPVAVLAGRCIGGRACAWEVRGRKQQARA